MMRATGAKLRMLASEAVALGLGWREVDCGGEVEECGDEDDMALCRAAGAQVHGRAEWLAGLVEVGGSTQLVGLGRAIGGSVGIQEQCVDVQVGGQRGRKSNSGRARARKGEYTHHWRLEAIDPAP